MSAKKDSRKTRSPHIARDALNLALGNTDNHARNTAVTKTPDGTIAISPLYDFAPMFLDADGIPRVIRWGNALERGHSVDWKRVIHDLPLDDSGRESVRARLERLGKTMQGMSAMMDEAGVAPMIVSRRGAAIDAVTKGLSEL